MSKGTHKKINSLNLLISLVMAFCAWFYVAYSINPITSRVYRDVPITFEGEYDLGMDGLGVESASADTVNVKVALNRKDVGSMSAARITAVADVSNLGEGDSKVEVKVSVPDGMSVRMQSVGSVGVKVAKSSNIDVDVAVGYDKPTESNTEPVATSISSEKVSVMGARLQVDKVAYVLVPLDEELVDTEGSVFSGKPVAVDRTGSPVAHVVVMPDTIRVEAFRAPLKTVDLKVEVINSGAGSSKRSYTVPSKVTIKGSAEIMDDIDSISAESVDISEMKKNGIVPLEFKLPEGVYISNASMLASIKVKVNK